MVNRSRTFGTSIFAFLITFSFANAALAGDINLQGGTIHFNKGDSKIFDNGHLTIATDDYLNLNASKAVKTSDHLQVGNTLILANRNELKDTGSQLYDDGQLRIKTDDHLYLTASDTVHVSDKLKVGETLIIANQSSGLDTGSKLYDDGQLRVATDDYLYLDIPNTIYVQNHLNVAGTLTVSGTLSVTGALSLPAGSVTATMLATDSVTTAKVYDGTLVNADINSAAAIAGSKINPDFGSQNITTGGTVTIGSGSAISKHMTGTAALNLSAPGAVPGCVETSAISVSGAALGNTVVASMTDALPANYIINGYVSAANSVVVRLCQLSGSATDPDDTDGATYRVDVWQH